MKKTLVLLAFTCATTLMAERAVYLQTTHTDYWWVTAAQEKCWEDKAKDGQDMVDMLYGCKMGYPTLIKKAKGTKLTPPAEAVAVLIRNGNQAHILCQIPSSGVAIRLIGQKRGIFGNGKGKAVCDWVDPSAAHNIPLEYAKTSDEAKQYAGAPVQTKYSLSRKGPVA